MGRGRGAYRWVMPSERAVIAARYGAGATVREVAAEFGVSSTTVWRIAHDAALSRRRVAHSPWRLSFVEREEIFAGICGGHSESEIARRLGRHRSTIGREIARCGGRHGYRPLRAERAATSLAKRPKPTKLAACPPVVGGGRGGTGAALVAAADRRAA